ncbi:hypothetical protein ACFV6D_04705 [Kitasatospora sp. NPDC059812]|uniref:hypothetical protein n=1 Tax=Kitasatospora sp. NPDC059812 TaxID=3346958 RepID=UPI0036698AEB
MVKREAALRKVVGVVALASRSAMVKRRGVMQFLVRQVPFPKRELVSAYASEDCCALEMVARAVEGDFDWRGKTRSALDVR